MSVEQDIDQANAELDELYFTDIYGRDDLKAKDLDGKEQDVTITSVEVVEVKKWDSEDRQSRILIQLDKFQKGLVLNATNGRKVYALYGNRAIDWVGKAITLYASETEVGGKTMECIRVRPTAPTKRPASRTRRKK